MTLFTPQSTAVFYDKLFSSLNFTLPQGGNWTARLPQRSYGLRFHCHEVRKGSQITDLADYQENNRLISHYCGLNILESLPSYWIYDLFPQKLEIAPS